MSSINLKQYYPAADTSDEEIIITDVKTAPIPNAWVGKAQLPHTKSTKKVVIYEVTLENGHVDRRLVPAACPHQGYDISHDALKDDGNVYCTLHKRPICIYSEYNRAYSVEKRGEIFFIPSNK